MKKKLYFLNEEEKQRILNLHEERTKKQYLKEWGFLSGGGSFTRGTEKERNAKVYDSYVFNCEKLIPLSTIEPSEAYKIAEKIHNVVNVQFHLDDAEAGKLKSFISGLKNAPDYCVVDRKFMDIVRIKGVWSAWSSANYNYLHEIVSHVFYYNSAFNDNFFTPLSNLSNWSGKQGTSTSTASTASTSSTRIWVSSNLTENPSPSNEYNCVKFAFKKDSNKNWPASDLDKVDRAYLPDPNKPGEYTDLFYYYGYELRYYSDGIWQSRTNKKLTGKYSCGPGEGLDAVITGSTSTGDSGKKGGSSGGGSGGGGGAPVPVVNCNSMGTVKLTQSQISELRKKVGSTETGSSLSQAEINLIYNKIMK